MGKLKDLTGMKFGRLTVIERAENKDKYVCWLCKCDCGNEVVVKGFLLKNGHTKSCGCLHDEKAKERIEKVNESGICKGKNHYRYNPNLTDEERCKDRNNDKEYRQWKQEVKRQANWTCDICGKRGVRLNAHHLESYSSNEELRHEVSNGICLCEQCHKEFHHCCGYGNNTKQQYEEFKQQNK